MPWCYHWFESVFGYDHTEMVDYEQWSSQAIADPNWWLDHGRFPLTFVPWYWRTDRNLTGWPPNNNAVRDPAADPQPPTSQADRVGTWWYNDIDTPPTGFNPYAIPPQYDQQLDAFSFNLAAPLRTSGNVVQVVGKQFPIKLEFGAAGINRCLDGNTGQDCSHSYWDYIPNTYNVTLSFTVSDIQLEENGMLRMGWMTPYAGIDWFAGAALLIRRKKYYDYMDRPVLNGTGAIGLKQGSMWALVVRSEGFDQVSSACPPLPLFATGDTKLVPDFTVTDWSNFYCPHHPAASMGGIAILGAYDVRDLDHTSTLTNYRFPGLTDEDIPATLNVSVSLTHEFTPEPWPQEPLPFQSLPLRGVHRFGRTYTVNDETYSCSLEMDWSGDYQPTFAEIEAMAHFLNSFNCGAFLADGWVQGPGQFSHPQFQTQTARAGCTVSNIVLTTIPPQ